MSLVRKLIAGLFDLVVDLAVAVTTDVLGKAGEPEVSGRRVTVLTADGPREHRVKETAS